LNDQLRLINIILRTPILKVFIIQAAEERQRTTHQENFPYHSDQASVVFRFCLLQ